MTAREDTRWKTLFREHEERGNRFRKSYKEKSELLVRELAPDIEEKTLGVLQEIGFTFVGGLLKKIEKDRAALEAELDALEDKLTSELGAEPGYLGAELDKLSGHHDALQPFLKKCFGHPRFDELLLDGYGTDAYKKKIWHLSYHLDRRAAREIERMCDGRSFSSIRNEAVQALEASKVLKERIEALKLKRKLRAAAEKRKRTIQSRLESHKEIWLASARRQLLEELESNTANFLDQLLEATPEIAFDWRLSRELLAENAGLWSRFLRPAQEAWESGKRASSDLLLKEYEECAESLKRFDQPSKPKESVDWKGIIYGDDESF